jgi:hypothetical protein
MMPVNMISAEPRPAIQLPGVRRPVGALVGCDLSQPFDFLLDGTVKLVSA